MIDFKSLYAKVKGNYERKQKGELLAIPPPFPRFSRKFGGWMKGVYYGITAHSGVGKTKFAKFMTVLSLYKETYETNIKPKVFYFALEESEEEFWLSMMCVWLYEAHKIEIGVKELQSMMREPKLDQATLDKLLQAENFITRLQEIVVVVDYIRNPTGIMKYILNYFDDPEVGHFVKEVRDDKEYIRGYEYKNKDHWVFAVFDHISLLSAEKRHGVQMSTYDTLDMFSKDYCMDMFCKKLKMVVVSVHQQTPAAEQLLYTNRGELIEAALEPSLDGLHLNKSLQQDYGVVFGLFNPYRYGIQEHHRYKIGELKNKYRSLKILKDRHFGTEAHYTGLRFEGASGVCEELPRAEDFATGKVSYADWR